MPRPPQPTTAIRTVSLALASMEEVVVATAAVVIRKFRRFMGASWPVSGYQHITRGRVMHAPGGRYFTEISEEKSLSFRQRVLYTAKYSHVDLRSNLPSPFSDFRSDAIDRRGRSDSRTPRKGLEHPAPLCDL